MIRKIDINFREWHGWQYYQIRGFDIWFNGYILNDSQTSFLNKGIELLDIDLSTNDDFDYWIRSARGHFSFIISNENKLLCGVDRVRSIPLFFNLNDTEIIVSNYAPDINKTIGANENKYNKQAVLEISMSGYTIGKKTLHPQISQLCAGVVV
jgi:asparagine synthase (glutamine-hydrolysing)